MPLDPGKSRTAFEHNIRTEVEAGKPQKQAVAIAYAEKGRGDADWRSRVDAACSMMDGLCVADAAKQSLAEFVKTEFTAGRHPDIGITAIAGDYYLTDGNNNLFPGATSFKTKQLAERARSVALSKGHKYIA